MSADADGGQVAAVTKAGSCERTIKVGEQTYVFKHKWRLSAKNGVLLTTVLVDKKHPSRPGNKVQTYVENNEAEPLT